MWSPTTQYRVNRRPQRSLVMITAALLVLLVSACGGGGATPAVPTVTPPPAPTISPTSVAPSPTPTASASATRVPATPTAAAVSPTPTPGPGTPISIVLPGKRGGVLQLRSISQPLAWDTMDVRGFYEVAWLNVMFNQLIWRDPYRDGRTMAGDAAESWEIGREGNVLTFRLHKGIQFHDGTPFTSRDVAYNMERAWKPRTTTMTVFKGLFAPIANIETPDDLTLRITLSKPSSSLFESLGNIQFNMYPAQFPFPEKFTDWKKAPIGTGPFKFKSIVDGVKMEYVRSDNYWRQGLPYVDGIVLTNIPDNAAGLAVWRTGKVDGTGLDGSVALQYKDILEREVGTKFIPIVASVNMLQLAQRAPWTDPRVREAVSLGLERDAIVTVYARGHGSPFAAPLLPPELGGQWGLSTEDMKTRPGYRLDKKEDVARGQQLLAQAGIDLAKVTVNIIGGTDAPDTGSIVERSVAGLGFKTKLELLPSGVSAERAIRVEFDIAIAIASVSFDDPSDHLGSWILSTGGNNYPRWSNPKLDSLFEEQDRTLDVARRKQMLIELQEIVLQDRTVIPAFWRKGWTMYQPWLKNTPTGIPFNVSPRFRWEQVYLER